MQPTYLPWAGYFNLISLVDIFIFLDDVQYEKSSWQNRNRILINHQPHFLTVPILHKSLSQKINEIEIDDKKNWRKKHSISIQNNYAKCRYIEHILPIIDIIYDKKITNLCELNIKIITLISKLLDLSPVFLVSSQLGIEGKRSEKIIKICQYLGCEEYISPIGAKEYIDKDGLFNNSMIKLTFQEFIPTAYPQKDSNNFISHLSIIDLVANIGWSSASDYVRSKYL
ncbi:WbqC family protein [Thermosynechococcus sp. PP45]|uniref:WbqC family protein n=1 Tax=unclassified Thermosynechococcus TaxID=2622553 RepID=UPI002672D0E3|nr:MULTISPECIES: WbqC family protein [unclassified Thermosynechococcus]WKT81354.1 WbqC family protein [Thermosynechococcus sp. PP45]WNC24966.1 WbqC family protein [Thermosynechococcus sp. PP551]WNC27543.1 WbqC family protein [Thermosynechococcus sp. PP555]